MPKHYIEEDLGPERRGVEPPFIGRLGRDTVLGAEYVLWTEAQMDAASHPKPISDSDSPDIQL